MQERFYSVQKACFYVCPGAQANEGVAFLQEIHGAFPFQWRRTGRTFGGPLFFFTSFLPAVLLPDEFPQPLHLHLSAQHELPEV